MDEEKIIKKHIQNNIISNNDNYNPRQLTCFHKPWAILYGSIKKEYFDLYLLSTIFYENFGYNNYFKWFDFCGNLNENYYKFAKEILEPRFGIEVNKHFYKDLNQFVSGITKLLMNDERILVPADLIYIPYYEDYKINNHIHFFIVKGFDMEKKIFYILDNMHIDNGAEGIYKNFVITFERLFKCALTSRNSYFSNEEGAFFWSLRRENECVEYTIEEALFDHKKELTRANLITFPEANLLIDNEKSNIPEFARSYAKVINYKEVYYDVLIRTLKSLRVNAEILENIINLHNDNNLKWENLRTKVLYFYRKKKGLSNLKNEFMLCKNDNLELFRQIISTISGVEKGDIIQNSRMNDYYNVTIYNPNNANIYFDKDDIIIEHDRTKAYDTWKNQNNATQLLFNVKTNDKINLEINLKLDNKVDFPFFSGLIVITKDEKILLFGNDAMCSMALYCPQYEADFTINKTGYYSDYMKLRINMINTKIIFEYFDFEINKWIIWENPDGFEIKQIGLISKTWNAIEHKSIFSNIIVKVNDEQINIFKHDKIGKE